MKMKDLNEKYGDDDFGLKDRGRELDNDERGMSGRDFGDSKMTPSMQLKMIQNIDSKQTLKTLDGEEVEMDNKQATLLRSMIDGSMGPNTIAMMFKPSAVERMTAIIMDSTKLKKLLSSNNLILFIALSTSASGQGSLYFSSKFLSNDPALTPILIEQLLSLAALTTSKTLSLDPILPGLILKQLAPIFAASMGF